MRIIDPHVHLWDPRTTPRQITPLVKLFGRWPGMLERLGRALTPTPLVDFVGDTQYVMNAHLPADFRADASCSQGSRLVGHRFPLLHPARRYVSKMSTTKVRKAAKSAIRTVACDESMDTPGTTSAGVAIINATKNPRNAALAIRAITSLDPFKLASHDTLPRLVPT